MSKTQTSTHDADGLGRDADGLHPFFLFFSTKFLKKIKNIFADCRLPRLAVGKENCNTRNLHDFQIS